MLHPGKLSSGPASVWGSAGLGTQAHPRGCLGQWGPQCQVLSGHVQPWEGRRSPPAPGSSVPGAQGEAQGGAGVGTGGTSPASRPHTTRGTRLLESSPSRPEAGAGVWRAGPVPWSPLSCLQGATGLRVPET